MKTGVGVNGSQTRSSPKWSMRARTTSDAYATRRDNPGPGAYNLGSSQRHKSPASYGFGSSRTERGLEPGQREGRSRPGSAPGPGQYRHENLQFPTKSASPNYGFGKSPRSIGSSNNGGYDIRNALASPGPGHYNGDISPTRHQQPNYTASPRRPMSAGASTPGPGAYNSARGKPDREASPHWRFGTEIRKYDTTKDVPGPGNYNAKFHMGAEGSPKFSMRAKHGNLFRDYGVPGPGTHG